MLAVYILIAATVLFSATIFSRQAEMYRYSLIPGLVWERRQLYRLFSHMFVHGDWMHLLVNMLVFYSFARFVTPFFSGLHQGTVTDFSPSVHVLLLYLGGGLFSALCSCVRHRHGSSYQSIGASGAVSAVVFCSIVFSPWSKIYLFGLVGIPGFLFGLLYVVYSVWAARRGGDGIDHWSHLYGALYGALYPLSISPRFFSYFLSLLRGDVM